MNNYQKLELLKVLISEAGTTCSLLFTKNNQYLVGLAIDCKVWHLHGNHVFCSTEDIPFGNGDRRGLLFSTDESILYIFGLSEIAFYDFPTLTRHFGTGTSPDQSYLEAQVKRYGQIAYPEDRALEEGDIIHIVEDTYRKRIYVARDKHGGRAYWDLSKNYWVEGGPKCKKLANSGDGKTLIGMSSDGGGGYFVTWKLAENDFYKPDQPRELRYHKKSSMKAKTQSDNRYLMVKAFELGTDGQIAFFGYNNGDIELWQIDSFASLALLKGHQAPVRKIAVSPDGKIIASGCKEGVIKLWDISTCTELQSIEAHDRRIYDLVFSPDGTLLASSSSDKTIKIWGVPGTLDGL